MKVSLGAFGAQQRGGASSVPPMTANSACRHSLGPMATTEASPRSRK